LPPRLRKSRVRPNGDTAESPQLSGLATPDEGARSRDENFRHQTTSGFMTF
jgi:hypothetical protein